MKFQVDICFHVIAASKGDSEFHTWEGETGAVVGSPPGALGRAELGGLETGDEGGGAGTSGLGDGEMDCAGTGLIVGSEGTGARECEGTGAGAAEAGARTGARTRTGECNGPKTGVEEEDGARMGGFVNAFCNPETLVVSPSL